MTSGEEDLHENHHQKNEDEVMKKSGVKSHDENPIMKIS